MAKHVVVVVFGVVIVEIALILLVNVEVVVVVLPKIIDSEVLPQPTHLKTTKSKKSYKIVPL